MKCTLSIHPSALLTLKRFGVESWNDEEVEDENSSSSKKNRMLVKLMAACPGISGRHVQVTGSPSVEMDCI